MTNEEPEARVVLTTAPDRPTAERLADQWVQSGLAACVNLVPGITSFYVWKGETHRDAEVLLVAKTTAARADALVRVIEDEHPYDCPEAVVIDVAGGSAAYLSWIAGAVG